VSVAAPEGCFVCILLGDTLLVVAGEEIELGKVASATEPVDKLVDAGRG